MTMNPTRNVGLPAAGTGGRGEVAKSPTKDAGVRFGIVNCGAQAGSLGPLTWCMTKLWIVLTL